MYLFHNQRSKVVFPLVGGRVLGLEQVILGLKEHFSLQWRAIYDDCG